MDRPGQMRAFLGRDDAVGLETAPASGAVCRALAADRTPDGSRTFSCSRTLQVRREGAPDNSRGGCAPQHCHPHRSG